MADSTDRADAKARTRRAVAARLTGLSASRRRAAGVSAARHLAAVPAAAQAATLMAFLSLPTEICTWPIIQWAWGRGKRVVIPRLDAPGERGDASADARAMVPVLLEPADVASASAHPALRPGRFGILTAPEAPAVAPAEIDVVLVPCRAVDRRGNRLGKGGGYYDRLLAQSGVRAVRIALALAEQVLDAVPAGPHDQPMDMIVTDAEVLRFNHTAAGPAPSENPSGEE